MKNKFAVLGCQLEKIYNACAQKNLLSLEELEPISLIAEHLAERLDRLVTDRKHAQSVLRKYGYVAPCDHGSAA